MAEIRIEKKKGMPAWGLLLALIVLLVLVWAILAMRSHRRPEAPPSVAVAAWSVPSYLEAPVVSTTPAADSSSLPLCALAAPDERRIA